MFELLKKIFWDHLLANLLKQTSDALSKQVSEKVGDAIDAAGARTPTDTGDAVGVVPKGLRSFDQEDAGFFLRLLPGPYRHDGLPESLHFWKKPMP